MHQYNAMTIAGYITHRALETGESITHLQLQKILYYLQANWLKKYRAPLFKDEIQKWKLGPVVPTVYREFKAFGANPITYIPSVQTFDPNEFKIETWTFNPNEVNEETQDEMDSIIDKLVGIHGFVLVEKTHNHSIWSDYEDRINAGETGIKYSRDEITRFFDDNPEELRFLNE